LRTTNKRSLHSTYISTGASRKSGNAAQEELILRMKAALPSLQMDMVGPTIDTLMDDIEADSPGITLEDYRHLRYGIEYAQTVGTISKGFEFEMPDLEPA